MTNGEAARYISLILEQEISNFHIVSISQNFPLDTITVDCYVQSIDLEREAIKRNSHMYRHADISISPAHQYASLKFEIPIQLIANYTGKLFFMELTEEDELKESLGDDNEKSIRDYARLQHEEGKSV